MKGIESSPAIPYPTPYMQGLFPSLCRDLAQLDELVSIALRSDASGHRQVVATLNELLAGHYGALALFLGHPTRRLYHLLLAAVAKAEDASAWLIEHPATSPVTAPADCSYDVICERVRIGVADWRLSIDLSRAQHDLDQGPVETVH